VQKQTKDRLRQAASFDDGWFNEALEPESHEAAHDGPDANVRRFFATENGLLSDREKQVLSQRFGFAADGSTVRLKAYLTTRISSRWRSLANLADPYSSVFEVPNYCGSSRASTEVGKPSAVPGSW
jgi:hypothetical protein